MKISEDIIKFELEEKIQSKINTNSYEKIGANFLVEYKEKKIIGFIAYVKHEKYIEIIQLLIAKKYKKKGIATNLIKKLPNSKRIYLEVGTKNIVAINLYKKNNFIIDKIIKNYYKNDDALIMYYEKIVDKAYAKINYLLNIESKRKDNFHNINFVMDKINLWDDIIIETSNVFSLECEEVFDQKNNIVYKTYLEMKKKNKKDQECKIKIKKNIPIAAGMGGGSADSASVLRGLNKLWNLQLTKKQLAEIGLKLGSDVPFCVYQKLAIVKGIGEKITFLKDPIPQKKLIIINPNQPLLTKKVFENHIIKKNSKLRFNQIVAQFINGNYENFYNNIFNDFDKTSSKMIPEILEIKNILKRNEIITLMSGSGPTVIGFSDDIEKLKKVKEQLKEQWFSKIIF